METLVTILQTLSNPPKNINTGSFDLPSSNFNPLSQSFDTLYHLSPAIYTELKMHARAKNDNSFYKTIDMTCSVIMLVFYRIMEASHMTPGTICLFSSKVIGDTVPKILNAIDEYKMNQKKNDIRSEFGQSRGENGFFANLYDTMDSKDPLPPNNEYNEEEGEKEEKTGLTLGFSLDQCSLDVDDLLTAISGLTSFLICTSIYANKFYYEKYNKIYNQMIKEAFPMVFCMLLVASISRDFNEIVACGVFNLRSLAIAFPVEFYKMSKDVYETYQKNNRISKLAIKNTSNDFDCLDQDQNDKDEENDPMNYGTDSFKQTVTRNEFPTIRNLKNVNDFNSTSLFKANNQSQSNNMLEVTGIDNNDDLNQVKNLVNEDGNIITEVASDLTILLSLISSLPCVCISNSQEGSLAWELIRDICYVLGDTDSCITLSDALLYSISFVMRFACPELGNTQPSCSTSSNSNSENKFSAWLRGHQLHWVFDDSFARSKIANRNFEAELRKNVAKADNKLIDAAKKLAILSSTKSSDNQSLKICFPKYMEEIYWYLNKLLCSEKSPSHVRINALAAMTSMCVAKPNLLSHFIYTLEIIVQVSNENIPKINIQEIKRNLPSIPGCSISSQTLASLDDTRIVMRKIKQNSQGDIAGLRDNIAESLLYLNIVFRCLRKSSNLGFVPVYKSKIDELNMRTYLNFDFRKYFSSSEEGVKWVDESNNLAIDQTTGIVENKVSIAALEGEKNKYSNNILEENIQNKKIITGFADDELYIHEYLSTLHIVVGSIIPDLQIGIYETKEVIHIMSSPTSSISASNRLRDLCKQTEAVEISDYVMDEKNYEDPNGSYPVSIPNIPLSMGSNSSMGDFRGSMQGELQNLTMGCNSMFSGNCLHFVTLFSQFIQVSSFILETYTTETYLFIFCCESNQKFIEIYPYLIGKYSIDTFVVVFTAVIGAATLLNLYFFSSLQQNQTQAEVLLANKKIKEQEKYVSKYSFEANPWSIFYNFSAKYISNTLTRMPTQEDIVTYNLLGNCLNKELNKLNEISNIKNIKEYPQASIVFNHFILLPYLKNCMVNKKLTLAKLTEEFPLYTSYLNFFKPTQFTPELSSEQIIDKSDTDSEKGKDSFCSGSNCVITQESNHVYSAPKDTYNELNELYGIPQENNNIQYLSRPYNPEGIQNEKGHPTNVFIPNSGFSNLDQNDIDNSKLNQPEILFTSIAISSYVGIQPKPIENNRYVAVGSAICDIINLFNALFKIINPSLNDDTNLFESEVIHCAFYRIMPIIASLSLSPSSLQSRLISIRNSELLWDFVINYIMKVDNKDTLYSIYENDLINIADTNIMSNFDKNFTNMIDQFKEDKDIMEYQSNRYFHNKNYSFDVTKEIMKFEIPKDIDIASQAFSQKDKKEIAIKILLQSILQTTIYHCLTDPAWRVRYYAWNMLSKVNGIIFDEKSLTNSILSTPFIKMNVLIKNMDFCVNDLPSFSMWISDPVYIIRESALEHLMRYLLLIKTKMANASPIDPLYLTAFNDYSSCLDIYEERLCTFSNNHIRVTCSKATILFYLISVLNIQQMEKKRNQSKQYDIYIAKSKDHQNRLLKLCCVFMNDTSCTVRLITAKLLKTVLGISCIKNDILMKLIQQFYSFEENNEVKDILKSILL